MRWPRYAAAALGSLFTLLVAGFLSLTCRPAWFEPGEIDYARLESDKRDFVALFDTVGLALHRGQAVRLDLDAAQVNRWIAARRELPSELIDVDLGPLRELRVDFLPGPEVRLAALADQNGLGVVASVMLGLSAAPETVTLTWDGAAAGIAPLPRSVLTRFAGDVSRQRAPLRDLLATGTASVPNDFIWPNGKRRFRIDAIRHNGRLLQLELSPR